jgi:hypothetical protein
VSPRSNPKTLDSVAIELMLRPQRKEGSGFVPGKRTAKRLKRNRTGGAKPRSR